MTKTCTSCGETRPLDEFYPHPKTKDRRQARCKQCDSTRRATNTKVLYNRARHRAVKVLIEAHADEFEQLLDTALAEVKAEADDLAKTAPPQKTCTEHPDTITTPRLRPGARTPGETVADRIRADVGTCPDCIRYHDHGHICAMCGAHPSDEAKVRPTRPRVDVDQVAVQRAMAGDTSIALNQAERRQAIALLRARGKSQRQIANLLGVTSKTIERHAAAGRTA